MRVDLPKPANLDLSGFYDLARTFCKRFPEKEWSGYMLYSIEKGHVFSEMDLKYIDFILLDIGTAGHTSFSPMENGLFVDFILENGYVNKGYKVGLVHSHNNMDVFFSGTDTDTLLANAKLSDMFLSVIVNNNMEVTAKIAVELEGTYTAKKTKGKGKVKGEITGIKEVQTSLFKENESALKQIRTIQELTEEKKKKALSALPKPSFAQQNPYEGPNREQYKTPSGPGVPGTGNRALFEQEIKDELYENLTGFIYMVLLDKLFINGHYPADLKSFLVKFLPQMGNGNLWLDRMATSGLSKSREVYGNALLRLANEIEVTIDEIVYIVDGITSNLEKKYPGHEKKITLLEQTMDYIETFMDLNDIDNDF